MGEIGGETRCFSPAKINLTLRVTGRRDDGYHELDSIFVPLDFGDDLVIRLRAAERGEVRCCCPGHPELETADNLAHRAAARYLELTGWNATVEIEYALYGDCSKWERVAPTFD